MPPVSAQDARGARQVAAAIALAMLLLGLLLACCPLDTLLSRFHPDDVFYYYNTARNFAQTGFSSFDGLHFTNGYQPLWFLVCAAMFVVFPAGGELPLRLLLLVQVALSTAATFLLVRLVARRTTAIGAAVAFVPFVMLVQITLTNGLETALLMFCLALLLERWDRCLSMPCAAVRPRDLFWLGVAAGCTFLARTDSVFLIAAVAIGLAWRHRPAQWRLLLWFAAPLALLAGGYLASNLVLTGHLMPVSGAAKVFHSRQLRHEAVARTGKAGAWIENLFWPFHGASRRYIAFAIVAPWVLMAAAWWRRGPRVALQPLLRLWPLAVGAVGSWLFYGTAFWGGFSQTGWYYPPHALLACCVLATLDAAVARGTGGRVPAGLVALGGAAWLLAGGIGAGDGTLLAGVFVVVGAGWLLARLRRRHVTPLVAAAIALLVTGRQGGVLERMIREGPTNWNWNLYLGALWARDHLPVDATIWSGSAGILGYFSGRTVVNTDGLANSFEFLDGVLRAGKLDAYLRRWDYTIDAMGDESLAQYYPDGRFVPLPPELSPRRLQFADGAGRRSLRVFRMHAGDGSWPPVPAFSIALPADQDVAVGAKVTLQWSAHAVLPGTRVSLCCDPDDEWNGNEHWICVDAVAAVPGASSYEWDTRGLPAGDYRIGGYLFDVYDGQERWTRARAEGRIRLRGER